jgi:hypothetical protein
MDTSSQATELDEDAVLSELLDNLDRIDAGNPPPFPPLAVMKPREQSKPKGGKGDVREGRNAEERAKELPAPKREPDEIAVGGEDGSGIGPSQEERWPDGPVVNNRAFGAENTAQLVAALIPAAQSNAGRLTIALLREAMKRTGFDGATTGRYVLPLFIWLLKAGVLADDGEPWENRPYMLALADREQIRQALRATAPPDPEEIARAKEAGLK